ncbi:MAG: hypothetical protein WCI29_08700, partial [Actinomycetes bacterium]
MVLALPERAALAEVGLAVRGSFAAAVTDALDDTERVTAGDWVALSEPQALTENAKAAASTALAVLATDRRSAHWTSIETPAFDRGAVTLRRESVISAVDLGILAERSACRSAEWAHLMRYIRIWYAYCAESISIA